MSASFEEWISTVFDRDLGEPEWYWHANFAELWEPFEGDPGATVSNMTRLFNEHHRLSRYSLEQVGKAVWFLIGEASKARPSYSLLDPAVPTARRVACLDAMVEFFRGFVALAAPGPSRHNVSEDVFQGACYMWWDIFPYRGGPGLDDPALSHECLETMTRIAAIPNELCQISALHGLNHWYPWRGTEVEQIVGAFLKDGTAISPVVEAYARHAMYGECL